MPAIAKTQSARAIKIAAAAKAEAAALKKQKALAAKKKVAKVHEIQSGLKPLRVVMNKAQYIDRIATMTGQERREVIKFLNAQEQLTLSALMPRAIGEITHPGLVKLVAKKIPAKKGGQKVMSFGVERISQPKPATVRVKARLFAKVKQVALPL